MRVQVLQGKGLVHPEELRATIEEVEMRGQKALGAQLVAKAWVDPAFKARLLRDANAAGAELGIAVGQHRFPHMALRGVVVPTGNS